ncbi:kinesin heavy chain [Neoconidiobolus thromboides FSU 785]|nr:kinesin heavy chain [Neoconidiobolus thromboides FSU 785]
MAGNNIRVLCRFRPQNKREIEAGGQPCIKFSEDMTTVQVDSKEYPGDFTFDAIYDHTTSQKDFFESSVKATVDDVIKGYNGTVFAYGQTGAGKTFTMMGAGGLDNVELKGITPRIIETIFESIYASTSNIEYLVKVSYMEIYMEKIKDLLNPVNDNLPIHEDKVNGIYVKGMTELYVSSVEEVYEVLNRGGANRVVAFTKMNAESSRSHSLFVINVEQKNLSDGSQKRGRMFLVDLAGSEKVGKTGASGQTLEEAKKINKSLSALGMVINSLTDGKSKHIPYRDSKLTRILQESLGGNSRTTLVINCSPSSYNDAETVSTLRFGIRAKSIKNKAKVNAELSPAELKAMLKKAKTQILTFQQYINSLEGETKIWRSGGFVPPENYAVIQKGPVRANSTSVNDSGPTTPTQQQTPLSPTLSQVPLSPTSSVSTLPPKPIPEHLADLSRPSTPGTLVEDEREEFIKRENSLSSALAEKENDLNNQTKMATEYKKELNEVKEELTQASQENKQMSSQLDVLKAELEKIIFEKNETQIQLDSITESNAEMTSQLQEVKEALTTLTKEKAIEAEEKAKLIKTIEMMNKIEPSLNLENWNAKEKELRSAMASLDSIEGKDIVSSEEAEALRAEVVRSRAEIENYAQIIGDLEYENDVLLRKCHDLDERLSAVELEYAEVLEITLAEEDNHGMSEAEVADLKEKIESQYNQKKEKHLQEIKELKEVVERKNKEIQDMNSNIVELKQVNEELKLAVAKAESNKPRVVGADKEKDIEAIRKTMAKQLSDFDVMKKSLMRDLQNKCEKVIELEITLESTRDQLGASLKSNNTKNQQQKMMFLERNLEQLTTVQKQVTICLF